MTNLLQGLNVFIIGMMGTGKTTVGQVLAKQLGYRFFDTDVLIERVVGKTINEIFAVEGEKKFRDLESKVLEELSAYTKSAIATGGGIILRRKNWSYLHHGLIVWLDAPREILLERLAGDNTRPLLQQPDPGSKLQSLLEERIPLYAQADLHIPITSEQTPEEIACAIVSKIPTVLKPEQLPQV
ncbi:MAG: shikimate kinase [Oscillatoria sp. PMC 1051.18]|nr:shikimate kinase [Oscillatoria sp. PMC 1050.18]MEC5030474.1 shikimate kinase [Oscillatoria sp. PMC 1051.18]